MNAELQQVGRMIKEQKEFEKRRGYSSLIIHSRLPQTIKVRRGLKVYKYKLHYGDLDDSVYISYSDDSISWKGSMGTQHKVLMHYDESTLAACISKAWRNLAENGIKVKGQI